MAVCFSLVHNHAAAYLEIDSVSCAQAVLHLAKSFICASYMMLTLKVAFGHRQLSPRTCMAIEHLEMADLVAIEEWTGHRAMEPACSTSFSTQSCLKIGL